MSEIKVAGSITECGFYRCHQCNRMINEGDEYVERDGYSYCMKCGGNFILKPQRCPICEIMLSPHEEDYCKDCEELQGQQLIWEAMSRNERTVSDGKV